MPNDMGRGPIEGEGESLSRNYRQRHFGKDFQRFSSKVNGAPDRKRAPQKPRF